MSTASALIRGSLRKNIVWNLVGQLGPMAAAVFAIPVLLDRLGTDRFGVLSLAWAAVGYFALFDFGMGRALTREVAAAIGRGQAAAASAMAWSALHLMTVLGFLGATIAAAITPGLVTGGLRIPTSLQGEARSAFFVLAGSLPFLVSTSGLRGVLEAHGRFALTNVIRVPMGLLMFLGPLAVLPFSNSLAAIVGVIVAVRVLAWILHLASCLVVVPEMRRVTGVSRDLAMPLLVFGGWMTVSSIVGPILLYADRFVIASALGATAVAYYSTPFEVVIKMLVVPAAVVGVLFPALSAAFAADPARARRLYGKAMRGTILLLLPVTLLGVLLARVGLTLWLGAPFAVASYRVAQLLAVGALINATGLISQAVVQTSGRPDLTAKLHLVELPLFLAYLFVLLHYFGLTGAATAWVIRVSLSAVVLWVMARRALASRGTAAASMPR